MIEESTHSHEKCKEVHTFLTQVRAHVDEVIKVQNVSLVKEVLLKLGMAERACNPRTGG